MGADDRQHVLLMGLQVADETSYARYRAGMMPILLVVRRRVRPRFRRGARAEGG